MIRQTDPEADNPVVSENARKEDVIATVVAVIILCNMLFVNSVVMRLCRAVAKSDCSWDYQHIVCNTTQGWCIKLSGRFYFRLIF